MKNPRTEIRLAAPQQCDGGNLKGVRSPKSEAAAGARDPSRFTAALMGALGAVSALTEPTAQSGLKSALQCTIAVWLLTAVLCLPVFAQYAIDWSTIDGGGGQSTGGVYTVTGTIGQPDAGRMSGTNASGQTFTLTGGFWGIVAAIQTTNAPFLTVVRTTTNTVAVSWPGPEAGWKLQSTTALLSGGSVWTDIPPPYTVSGANLVFTEAAPVGNKFYRLHKP